MRPKDSNSPLSLSSTWAAAPAARARRFASPTMWREKHRWRLQTISRKPTKARRPGNEGSGTGWSSLLGGLRRRFVTVTVYAIGHSTRPLDEFIALLRAHSVAQLPDVRTIPKSRRHPHFAADALSLSLAGAGIG